VLGGPALVATLNDLRRAWAVLGLRPGSSLEATRSAYRQLARRWHPDRFANDPVGQAQASYQMAIINGAYRGVLEAGLWQVPSPQTGTSHVGRRLSREEIDHFVASMGSDSWVDSLLLDGTSSSSPWAALDPSQDQWAITPGIATGLILCLGMLLIGLFEWFGRPLSHERGYVLAFVFGISSSVVSLFIALRRGW